MPQRLFWSTLIALVLAGPAAGEEPKTAAEIQACVEANLPKTSSVQSIALRAKDRVGAITTSKATIYWKKFEDGRSRVLIEFSLPDDLRGASLLMLERKQGERDMFMYLPELRSVKRITSRMVTGSMFGTDFSYEDFEMIEDYARKPQSQRIADASLEGETVWVLEGRPSAGEIGAYTRVVEYIDPKTCVRLKTELFEANDRLRKVASSDRKALSVVSGLHYASQLTLRDLVKQTETELAIEKIEVGVEIPARLFSQSNLTKGK
ncbi:MAG TPA: outer membrane lipoprotein-sorting protein [Myxococcota bacterium]|jgi:outer membrane lipoprotein-sorting protein